MPYAGIYRPLPVSGALSEETVCSSILSEGTMPYNNTQCMVATSAYIMLT